MSRRGDMITTIAYFCLENNIPDEKAIEFCVEVLCDSGQTVCNPWSDDPDDVRLTNEEREIVRNVIEDIKKRKGYK